jgi:hypothetical protein
MKKVLNTVWNFLAAVGEYRYQTAKRRGYGMY